MLIERLPNEILVKIFELLRVGDLLIVSLVCQKWRNAASVAMEEKVTIMAEDDFGSEYGVLKNSFVSYKYWAFKNIDLNYKGPLESVWKEFGDQVKSLTLSNVDISEKDLVNILLECRSLENLSLSGFSQIFMTGTFIENKEDQMKLQKTLRNVKNFRLSCRRYLTDSLFSRFMLLVGNLRELSLFGCQISYQNSIWKRFYPSDGSVKASEHVLTFKYVLKFIENNKEYLKLLDLGSTSIDSESLGELSQVPGLNLTSLHLESCDQLTKAGVQLLTQNQKHLVELDFSLCSRLTDYAIIAIADNLPHLKCLSVRRCQGITEAGLENLSRLKFLEKLDISQLGVRKWESIHEALGKLPRPSMRWLSVASLPIQWETVLALADTMPDLRYLDLSMCAVGVLDKSIQAICKSMVKLEVLFLSGCSAVSDIGLSGHGLGSRDTPESSEYWGTQLSLETLGIKEKDPFKVSLGSKAEQDIRKEAEVKKYLEDHMTQIITSSEYGLKNLPGLRQLNLYGCLRVNEEGLIQVSMNCPSLQDFFLTECANATDRVILVLSHRLKRLRTLDLQKCILLTNDSLDSLSSCRSLKYLDVSYCSKMTLEAVIELRRRIPRLIHFHHRGIKSSLEETDNIEQFSLRENKKIPTPPPLLSKLIRSIRS